MSLATGSTLAPKSGRAGDTRAAIVSALGGVEGLTGYPVTPDNAVAGAAWPNWVQTTYNGRLCDTAVRTYEVLITLPAAYLATTVDQGDAFGEEVATALMRIGVVTLSEPVLIPFSDRQTMPGLRFRVTIR
jgi:hypothetical protein